MNLLLKYSFGLFAFTNLFCQIEHVKILKEQNNPLIPNIAGFTEGSVPYFVLCDSLGIQSSLGYSVEEFHIEYKGEVFSIKGNQVPDSICVYIGSCNANQMIFFTDIYAVNERKEKIKLYPFNLLALKNED